MDELQCIWIAVTCKTFIKVVLHCSMKILKSFCEDMSMEKYEIKM